MSDFDDVLGTTSRSRLTADITLLMLKGGGIALVFCLVVLFTVLIIAAIGRALPEESRDTPDPVNRSSIELVDPEYIRVA